MGNATRKDRGASRERTKSPAGRRDRSAAAAFAEDPEDAFDVGSLGDLSKEVSHYLSTLNTSGQNKMSLLKMQIIKCDENSNLYQRMRNCFNRGDLDEADHYLATLEESNHQSQLDLKNEISDGPKTSAIVGMLCDQLKKERIENASQSRGRSPAKYASNRQRSASGNRTYGGAPDVSKLETQVGELRRNLSAIEDDNDKLKRTMREMVDDYTRQLELRDETIQRLESSQPNSRALKQEIDELQRDNRVLREKVQSLNRELDSNASSGARIGKLQDENDRLNRVIIDKERQIEK